MTEQASNLTKALHLLGEQGLSRCKEVRTSNSTHFRSGYALLDAVYILVLFSYFPCPIAGIYSDFLLQSDSFRIAVRQVVNA
ncbi:MAG: hypothetical protein H7A23_14050 [Leptospiraceae bacterium]|nr:hypothetical protein [Leptospiraceae bacterium]